MKITFTKKGGRTQLACHRSDGSAEVAMLGPQIPFHDLGHYVIEKKLSLHKGFFGYVHQGYSVNELSQKEVILSLDKEVWQAEILTRALGSLTTGACTVQQFTELVNTELEQFNWPVIDDLSEATIVEMQKEYQRLINQFKDLDDGQSMSVEFGIE